jgi:hypothetical protein
MAELMRATPGTGSMTTRAAAMRVTWATPMDTMTGQTVATGHLEVTRAGTGMAMAMVMEAAAAVVVMGEEEVAEVVMAVVEAGDGALGLRSFIEGR